MALRTGRRRGSASLSRACLCAVLGAVVPLSGAQRAAEPRVELRTGARALQPGEAVWLTVEADPALARAEATVFGRTITLRRDPSGLTFTALAGIDVGAADGPSEATVTAWTADGARVTSSRTVVVEPRTFPERRLSVAPKFVNPPPGAAARIRREGERMRTIYATATPERLWDAPFARPVEGVTVSGFGVRSIFNGIPREPHGGADFASAAGTPIRAPAGARVVLAEPLYFSGNTVVLDHGEGVYSVLAHLSAFRVEAGARVARGAIVGDVGATGRVTGPHLHWAVRVLGARVDPLSVIAVTGDGSADERSAR